MDKLSDENLTKRLDENALSNQRDFNNFILKEMHKGSRLNRHELAEVWMIQKVSNLQTVIDLLTESLNTQSLVLEKIFSQDTCDKCDPQEEKSEYICTACKSARYVEH